MRRRVARPLRLPHLSLLAIFAASFVVYWMAICLNVIGGRCRLVIGYFVLGVSLTAGDVLVFAVVAVRKPVALQTHIHTLSALLTLEFIFPAI